jgi:hypothetical protein
MSLAQVCYNISNDMDFADSWRRNPDEALAKQGLNLSSEEKAFLSAALQSGVGTISLRDVLFPISNAGWVRVTNAGWVR